MRSARSKTRFAEHEGIEPDISGRGGRVLKRFRHALNGIKIEIDRNEVAALAALPGVVAVLPVLKHRPNNAVSVPFIGAPAVWQGTPRLRGEGVKIAIIDTGIDYTHANFGGPGTVAAFQAADAASTQPANPALFGPNAPKVKGGTDLVGDAYNANAPAGSPALIPHPDPNPLDCNGHGSHVAGTAAASVWMPTAQPTRDRTTARHSSKRSRSDPESRPRRTSIPFASSAARVRPTS